MAQVVNMHPKLVTPIIGGLKSPEGISVEDHLNHSVVLLNELVGCLEKQVSHFAQGIHPDDMDRIHDLIAHATTLKRHFIELEKTYSCDLPQQFDFRIQMYNLAKLVDDMLTRGAGNGSISICVVMEANRITREMVQIIYASESKSGSNWLIRFLTGAHR
jgi:hypothetical protein